MGNKYVAALFRGGCVAVLFVLMSSLTTFLLQMATVSGDAMLQGVESFVIYIICTVFCVLIYNSFAFAFAYGNRLHIEEFLTRENKAVSFGGEVRRLFTTPMAIIELVGTLTVVLLSALLGAFPSIGGMFPSPITGGWFPAVTLTPLCLLISIYARYEAARHYEKLERENGIDKLLSRVWLPLRLLLLVVLYPIAAPLSPMLAFALFTIGALFAKVTALLTLLGAIAALVLLIVCIWGIKVLRNISKRRRFLRRVREESVQNGYTVKDIINPYRAFATSRNPCTFTLVGAEGEISCVIISTLWRRTPLVFTSPTDAQFLHRIGTKNHGFSIRHNIEFYHKGEGSRVIIVDPSPKEVFVAEDGREKRVYCADPIWKIPVHDADSFIGCMGRHCLIEKDTFRRTI